MDSPISPLERTLRGVAGFALLLFGLWLCALAGLVGLIPQRPNPYVPDGE